MYLFHVYQLIIFSQKLPVITFLLHGNSSGCGKRLIARRVAAANLSHLIDVDCYDLWSEVSGSSVAKIDAMFKKGTLLVFL
jgi:SpoVK/Ycf46/Vps4 family AAA+-type ATPase